MKRIDFFKQLFLGSSLLFIPKPTEAKPKTRITEIRLSSPFIAGFQYYDGPGMELQLKEEDSLLLKREPLNNFDGYAIEVYHHRKKQGYLPNAENKVIARMMDQGMVVKAKILKINLEVHAYTRVKMNTFYETSY